MANPAAGALVFDRGLAVQPQAWIDFVGPAGDIFSPRDQFGGNLVVSGRRQPKADGSLPPQVLGIDHAGPPGWIGATTPEVLSGSPHEAGKMNRTAAFVGVPLEGIFYGGQDFESALEEEG
jgi:hypothetical protein